MIKMIIFDLDGTLLNTLEDLVNSTNYALAKFNFPLKTTEEVRFAVGSGVEKLLECVVPEGKNNKDFYNCLAIFKDYYSQHNCDKTQPYQGIFELLHRLKQANIKIAVVSNKYDLAVNDLCFKYFEGLYDIAVGEHYDCQKKPCPDSVFKILDKFNLLKTEVIFVGDSEVDVETAKNARVKSISVLWGYRDKDCLMNSGAIDFINEPLQLLDYLN